MGKQILDITPEQQKAVTDLVCKCLKDFASARDENRGALDHIMPEDERMPYFVNLLCANLIASIFTEPFIERICEFYNLCKYTTPNHAVKWWKAE